MHVFTSLITAPKLTELSVQNVTQTFKSLQMENVLQFPKFQTVLHKSTILANLVSQATLLPITNAHTSSKTVLRSTVWLAPSAIQDMMLLLMGNALQFQRFPTVSLNLITTAKHVSLVGPYQIINVHTSLITVLRSTEWSVQSAIQDMISQSMENVLQFQESPTVSPKLITTARLVSLVGPFQITNAHTSLITAPSLMAWFVQSVTLIIQLMLMENAHSFQEFQTVHHKLISPVHHVLLDML